MKKDIFDRIMDWKIFKPLNPFYTKYKEPLLYLFFGGLTFLVSVLSYSACLVGLHMNALIANLISWVLAVAFAYVTNRIWVFTSVASGVKEILWEAWSFTCGRIATLVMEELILYVFITLLHFNGIVIKVIAQIIVILANYVISKLFVFKEKE